MSRRKRPPSATSPQLESPRGPFRAQEMLLFPATVFGLLLMLAGVGCPVQLARWEADDRATIAAGTALPAGSTPDAFRTSTVLLLGLLPLALGATLVARGYRQARNEHLYGDPNPDLRVRDDDVLFDAGRQLPKVRFVMWLAVACGLGGAWWGWTLLHTFGLSPGDGGVLRPFGTRLAVGSTVAGLGLAFAGAMLFYGRCYVAEIRRGAAPGDVIVHTVRLVGTRPIALRGDQLSRGNRHEGRLASVSPDNPFAAGIQVDAAWHSLRIPGRRLPLIVDDQGWFRGGTPAALDRARSSSR